MKKVIIVLISMLLAIGAVVGAVSVFNSCSTHSQLQSAGDSARTLSRLTYLESEYNVGDPIPFRLEVTSNTKFTKMTYSLNNGTDVSVTVKTGETQEMDNQFGNGKYFIDSGTEIIETDNLQAGYYTIVFKVHDDEGTTMQIGEPRMIKLNVKPSVA